MSMIFALFIGGLIGMVIADRIDERRHQRTMKQIPYFVRTGKWN